MKTLAMKIVLTSAALALYCAGYLPAQDYSIIPQPVKITKSAGTFTLQQDTRIAAGKGLERIAGYLQGVLRPATGFPFPIESKPGGRCIELRLDPRLQSLGKEGYHLSVGSNRIEIRAAQPNGVFYGVQTLRQLLPVAIYRQANLPGVAWKIPGVEIEDFPRFQWRGGHLDVGRHFSPKEFVLKYIDLLAMHKMNVFHFHLTEDQGWRIEIKKYPKLTQVGAWRKDTMLTNRPPTYTGKPHGGFYSQDDIREIIAYAADRFITIVPEIEMPGHSQAAIAAYPELGNTGEPLEVAINWGVIENVYNTEDSTIRFLQDVLAEVLELFPSQFIHVGGDECPKKQWKESPRAQARIKQLGLKNEDELQSWFIHQMDTFLTAKGRRLVGWDEILEGGLAPGATVMSWRGEKGGIHAAQLGHDVVMAPNTHTYFDYYQAKDRTGEPYAIGGFLPLDKVYSYEPIPADLTAEEAKHILGAQFQLWTEYIPNSKQVEYMAYPRACALSEAVWSAKEGRSYEGFLARMGHHTERLKALDVNFRKLDSPNK
jgi:hexosaminidase